VGRGRAAGRGHHHLNTDDIDAVHADLKARGVDVDDEVSRMGDPVPPLFWFRDPDGNTLMVVETA
jgi:catechol 2,3-dioxygenase-like lactoylglutathione lyase family enzyme